MKNFKGANRIFDAGSGCLSSVCIGLCIAFLLPSPDARAQAQFDPNIQSRLDTVTQKLTPTLDFSAPAGGETSYRVTARRTVASPEVAAHYLTQVHKKLSSLEVAKKFQSELDAASDAIKSQHLTAAHAKLTEVYKNLESQIKPAERTGINKWLYASQPVYEVDFKGQQPLTVSVQGNFKPAYESNAGRTAVNPQPDHYLNYGGTVQVTDGAGKERPYDVWAASAQTTSSRYDILNSKNTDSFVLQAAYQFFIDGFYWDKGALQYINPYAPQSLKNTLPAGGQVTYDVLLFGVSNQAAYTPVFKTETAELLTPQVQLSRQNIALFGHDDLCDPGPSIPDPAKPDGKGGPHGDNRVFCDYANVSINAGYTASPIGKLENGNIAATLTMGRRISGSNLSFQWESSITERTFTEVPGGRHDVTVASGPSLKYNFDMAKWMDGWKDGISANFALPVTYNENTSSIAKDDWKSWIVLPTLTLTFKATQPLDTTRTN